MKISQLFTHLYGVRKNVILGKNVHIGIWSILWAPNKLVLGSNIYIGKFCTIQVDGKIGSNVVVANQVGIIGRWDHDYKTMGKTIFESPWIGSTNYRGEGLGKEVVIEDDVWIGYGAVIFSGVIIGRGSIIGAGSVVTANVSPYSIVGGIPAKKIGMRFTPVEIKKHEELIYGDIITKL